MRALRRIAPLVVLCSCCWVPSAGAWTWPVGGAVLQGFTFDHAHPYAGGQHRGIDVGAAPGESVLAPASGVVSFAGTVPTSGKSVTIETPDGLSVTLTHLGSIAVARDAVVSEGAEVGTVGSSGTPEVDGPYVHLGVQDDRRRAGLPRSARAPAGARAARHRLRLRVPPAPVAPPVEAPAPVASSAPPAASEPPAVGVPPVAAAGPPVVERTACRRSAARRARPAPVGRRTGRRHRRRHDAPPVGGRTAGPAPHRSPRRSRSRLPCTGGGACRPCRSRPPAVARPAAPTAVSRSTAIAASWLGARGSRLPFDARRAPRRDVPAPAGACVAVGRVRNDAEDRARGDGARLRRRSFRRSCRGAVRAGHRVRPGRRGPAAVPAVLHRPRSLLPLVLVLLASVASARVASRPLVSSVARPRPPREHVLSQSVAEDPRRARVAVREWAAPYRPRGGLRRAGGRVRALSPAEGQRRADGQRNGRARHAGDGGRRPERRIAA